MTLQGTLLEPKRFAVHDGPGIRTTFFFKGFVLRCRWCHNPESISPAPQLGSYSHKCISCGQCAAPCPVHAHSISGGLHHFERHLCTACGACAEVCPGQALKLYVRSMSVEDVVKKFRTGMPHRLPVAEGVVRLDGCVVDYDHLTGRARNISAISCTSEV